MTDDEIRKLLSEATPGPWEKDIEAYEVRTVGNPYGAPAGSMKIADIRGWGHLTGRGGGCGFDGQKAVAIQTANAALIAAAPDLAAELLAAREVVRQMAAWMRDANQVGYCEDGAFDSLPGSDEAKHALLASARAITEGKT